MDDDEERRYLGRSSYAARCERETHEERETRLQRARAQRRRRNMERDATETIDERAIRQSVESQQRQQRRGLQREHVIRQSIESEQREQSEQVPTDGPPHVLPLARRVMSNAVRGLCHQLFRMTIQCAYCHALHWVDERSKGNGSTAAHPFFKTCCDRGKVELPPLTAPPEPLQTLLTENSTRAKKFRENIRAYNSALSFTSLGANIDERFTRGGIYSFFLQGALYHRIGSLVPSDGEPRKFAQLYIADSVAALDGRMERFSSLDRVIMQDLQTMLTNINPYVQIYETVRQRMSNTTVADIELRLLCLKSDDPRRYNCPTADEVGAIMVGDGHDGSISDRDIVVKCHSGELQRVSVLHSAYMPLRYVLLFPDGRQGWTVTMPLRGFSNDNGEFHRAADDHNAVGGRGGSGRITQMQYFSHILHQRTNPAEHFFRCGRLLQEYIVDAWASTEQNRLNYISENQDTLRAELYQGVVDALNAGDHDASQIGQRLILPSTFSGGPRQMNQLYQDAMAIVRKYGRPDLFITFTCNPKWQELGQELDHGQFPQDRPDLVSRVFNLKFRELMKDLLERKVFGTVVGFTWVIEFQKRGLPHAHILLILDRPAKLQSQEDIDSVASAELPDPQTHPEAYETVKTCMVHGPCGILNPTSPCMVNGKCTKRYPRPFNAETRVDEEGYPMYRRTDNGATFVDYRGNRIDNRWIVPHNLYLAAKYNAHINVEVCSSISAVKYLFKYVYKGHDRATVVLEDTNEIKQYIDARYVSPPEATWRLFGFKMHDHNPPIQRLQVHLPDQQRITFRADGNLIEALNRDNSRKTTLTQWFEANRTIPAARDVTYLDFPSCFVWNMRQKKWSLRQRGMSVGRMFFVSPAAGERYFLRTLLTVVKGAQSWSDLRTHEGVQYETFKAACIARGLYEHDEEWHQCLDEASVLQSGRELCSLFVAILLFGQPANPHELWSTFSDQLSDDCAHKLRQDFGYEHDLTPEHFKSFALHQIGDLLAASEKNLDDFGLPSPTIHFGVQQTNRLIAEQTAFNVQQLAEEVALEIPTLNAEQLHLYQKVMQSCDSVIDTKLFFIDGPGGTGKTYLENLLLKSVRAQCNIALATATSGIAALLLSNGRTAHSRFKIPIDVGPTSLCSIGKQTALANLIRDTKLILWDEAPMAHKFAIEALDRSLRDLTDTNRPFGCITVVMSGDFRQVLPVVPRGLRPDIVAASIKESVLWKSVEVGRLWANMRANSVTQYAELGNRTFADWLLALGEDDLLHFGNDINVQCPDSMLLIDQTLDGLINAIYRNISDLRPSAASQYFGERAILASRNDDVTMINSKILNKVPGITYEYLSADRVEGEQQSAVVPIEFLNTLEINGWPPHNLQLKVGTPVILLRNLDPAAGLCNGTRLLIRRCLPRVLEAEVMIGDHAGHVSFIPRIPLISEQTSLPYAVRRRQFPIRIAFAMTINKSQGQTLKKVGICLSKNVFTHGQLYVAFSRATSPDNVSVLLAENCRQRKIMHNIVYKEALR